MKIIEIVKKEKTIIGKVFIFCLWLLLRVILAPVTWIFEYCTQPNRLHRMLIWWLFAWFTYLLIDHGHDWLESVRCYWGWDSCGRYRADTPAEIMWRKTYGTPILVLGALSSTYFYWLNVRKEWQRRRELAAAGESPALSRWMPAWLDKYFWWL